MRDESQSQIVCDSCRLVGGALVDQRQERWKFRREGKAATDRRVEQWLLAHSVPCQYEASAVPIPQGGREHTTDMPEGIAPFFLVQMWDDVYVRTGLHAVTARFEVAEPLDVVIQLAVAHDSDGPILVPNGLITMLEVDNRESSHAEDDGLVHPTSVAVRSAVDESPEGLRHSRRGDSWIQAYDTSDAAHGCVGAAAEHRVVGIGDVWRQAPDQGLEPRWYPRRFRATWPEALAKPVRSDVMDASAKRRRRVTEVRGVPATPPPLDGAPPGTGRTLLPPWRVCG